MHGFNEISYKGCEQHRYGQFLEIADAKEACKNDKECSGIHDVECGEAKLFHLCPNVKNFLSNSESACTHIKIILGKTCRCFPYRVTLVVNLYFYFYQSYYTIISNFKCHFRSLWGNQVRHQCNMQGGVCNRTCLLRMSLLNGRRSLRKMR